MVILARAAGLWGQLLNFFFFQAALVSDVLLIRMCLVGGFVFLIVNGSTGIPDYKQLFYNTVDGEPIIFLDIIIWSVITGSIHVYVIYCLIKDEAHIKLKDDEEEAVWRLFYRRSGMPRLEFCEVVKRAFWHRVKSGEVIVDETNELSRLHFIVEGIVEFESAFHGVSSSPRKLGSGDLFDLNVTNVFGVKVGFDHDRFKAVAKTDCLLLTWTFDQVNIMASRLSPSISSYWRNMILYTVAAEYNRTHEGFRAIGAVDASGKAEDASWRSGARSRDFSPLKPEEEPKKNSFMGTLGWIVKSYNPFPPKGLRHNSLPVSGILAKNRVEALYQTLEQTKQTPMALGREVASSIMRHHDYFQKQSRQGTGLSSIGDTLEMIDADEVNRKSPDINIADFEE
eukprot:gene2621-5523_t